MISPVSRTSKKILKEIADKLEGVVRPSVEIAVKTLWVKFSDLYSIMTNECHQNI